MIRGRIVMLYMMRLPWMMGFMVTLIRRRRGNASGKRNHAGQTQQKNHCALHVEPSVSGFFFSVACYLYGLSPCRTVAMGWTVPLRPVTSIRVPVVAMTVRAMPVSVGRAMSLRPVSIAMMTAIWSAMPVHAGAMTVMHPGAVTLRPVVSLHA